MVKAKKFILAVPYDGEPKESNFKLIEEDLEPLKDGEILCQAEWLSVDPYMRAHSLTTGGQMIGHQVAKIIESKNPEYSVGKYVHGAFGWRNITKANPNTISNGTTFGMYLLPDLGSASESVGIGAAGMPGVTAYFGFLEICQPKAGDVVVVSTPAGAVGSLVAQIAPTNGCKVIGYTGSDAKVKWLKEIGFDHAFNYKTVDWEKSLKEAAPEGVDCYFDNVGGEFSGLIMFHMRDGGRISVCGAVSSYNNASNQLVKVPSAQRQFVFKQLKMEGFIVSRWDDRFLEGVKQMAQWIKEGKLKYKETVYEGFENMPKALISLMRGENIGKAVVKA